MKRIYTPRPEEFKATSYRYLKIRAIQISLTGKVGRCYLVGRHYQGSKIIL